MNTPRRHLDTVITSNSYNNLKVVISKFAKNYRTGTGLQHAQLGMVSIIAVKIHEILTNGFREIVFTRNFYKCLKVNISKFGKSAKNYRTGLQHVQLDMVSIIAVNVHKILSNGFREIVFTKSVYLRTDRQTDRQTDRRTDSVNTI